MKTSVSWPLGSLIQLALMVSSGRLKTYKGKLMVNLENY